MQLYYKLQWWDRKLLVTVGRKHPRYENASKGHQLLPGDAFVSYEVFLLSSFLVCLSCADRVVPKTPVSLRGSFNRYTKAYMLQC